mmetsp:Transcript_1904/g.2665  ORF Transcript_1904/g.2665 Transcript_1904/m.2665 type:complete len:180 (+) Transcript_1904:168-707(+)
MQFSSSSLVRLVVLLAFLGRTLAFRSLELNNDSSLSLSRSGLQSRGGQQTRTRVLDSSARSSSNRLPPSKTRLGASVQFKNVEQMLDNFRDEPVLIAFTAINCGPCRLQKKELASVKKDWSTLTMVAIDMDRWPKVGSRFQVGKLPCLVAFKNGEVLWRMEGLRTAEEIASNVRLVFQK